MARSAQRGRSQDRSETAEVLSEHGSTRDPYDVLNLDPDEEDNFGRNYFARSPESDVWVSFHDLPAAVCDRLWVRMRAGDFDDTLPF